jgi:hypothetical protein
VRTGGGGRDAAVRRRHQVKAVGHNVVAKAQDVVGAQGVRAVLHAHVVHKRAVQAVQVVQEGLGGGAQGTHVRRLGWSAARGRQAYRAINSRAGGNHCKCSAHPMLLWVNLQHRVPGADALALRQALRGGEGGWSGVGGGTERRGVSRPPRMGRSHASTPPTTDTRRPDSPGRWWDPDPRGSPDRAARTPRRRSAARPTAHPP